MHRHVNQSASETFTWVECQWHTIVTEWWLYLGTSPGARDIVDTGSLGSSTSYTANNLPTDGTTIHATLYYRNGSAAWQTQTFSYIADDS